MGRSQLPCMAFLFEDMAAARKIFERWRERFGAEDASEEIGIIRDLPDTNPHHYCVQIASKDPISRGIGTKSSVMVATRSMTMEPNDSRNLGACPNSRCSILVESDSTFGDEQVFSSLEYRSDATSAAECAGFCSEGPCLAVYR